MGDAKPHPYMRNVSWTAWTPPASRSHQPGWRTYQQAHHQAQGWGVSVIESGESSVIVTTEMYSLALRID